MGPGKETRKGDSERARPLAGARPGAAAARPGLVEATAYKRQYLYSSLYQYIAASAVLVIYRGSWKQPYYVLVLLLLLVLVLSISALVLIIYRGSSKQPYYVPVLGTCTCTRTSACTTSNNIPGLVEAALLRISTSSPTTY